MVNVHILILTKTIVYDFPTFHLCANGIPARGISKKSILNVAEESDLNGSGLNTALVKDLVDKQSVAYAIETFSENVEQTFV